jgi:GntR family transcriptional regulator
VLIRVEPSSGIPITRQIVDQIRARCASGLLQPGDRLPSVRELARELAVNQNTILRAYERLTAEGVLERRHGEGTFVADVAGGPGGGRRQLKREKDNLAAEAQRFVDKARVLGMSAEEVLGLVHNALDTPEPAPQQKP